MIILGYHPETFKKSKNQLRMNCIRYKIQVRDFIDKFFSGFHIVVIFFRNNFVKTCCNVFLCILF